MIYVFIAILVFVVVGIIWNFILSNKVNKEGIETPATVEVEINKTTDSEGFDSISTHYFAIYKNENGETIRARLINRNLKLEKNEKIRIKYIPKKPKVAYYIGKE